MATFTPPLDNQSPPTDSSAGSVSPVALDSRDVTDPLAQRLFRFYSTRRRGRNVFILKDGTVTENLPASTYDSSGNLVSNAWDLVADNPFVGKDTKSGPPGNEHKRVFWGGHGGYLITASEQTILTNAGYGSYIT